jgi:hypothetical protein
VRPNSAEWFVFDGETTGLWQGTLHWTYLAARAPLRLVAGENLLAKCAYLAVTGIGFGLYARRRWRAGPSWAVDGFLWCWLAGLLGLQLLTDVFFGSHLSVAMRYTMLAAPAMYLLLGFGLAHLWAAGRRSRWLFSALLVVMCVVAVGTVSASSRVRYPGKSNMREWAADLHSDTEADDLIVVSGGIGSPQAVSYYLAPLRPEQPMLHWPGSEGAPEARLPDAGEMRRYRRIWLFDYRSRGNGLAEISRWLDETFGPGQRIRERLWVYQTAAR